MDGFQYLIEGFRLIMRPGLKRYVIIPLFINMLIFITLIQVGVHWYAAFTLWIDGFLPSWLQWLNWLLWVLFAAAAVIVISYTFTIIANLVAAPFNGYLSEKVEALLVNKPLELAGDESKSSEQAPSGKVKNAVGAALSDIPKILKEASRAFKRQLQFILYYLPRALAGLLLFFIPGVQVLAPPIWFVFNGWMMAVQYMDYPMDNHKVSFQEMREELDQKRMLNLSFGSLVMLFTMIPVLNFFVMPAAVAGATALWVKEYQR